MKSLYLIDISSFIFRAYYAVRPLSTKAGVPVNAVYGVVSMIKNLIDKKKPDHLIVCLDRKEKGFRHELYPQYKANRSEPPEDLIPQFPLIREFVDTYPIKAIDKPGYEADDIIATLVKKYKHQKEMQIFIVSCDKDLMQLVDDNVFMYDTMKEKIIRREEVIEKFGVPPEKVVEVQALSGDSVDNIPGIAGVGPKTATKLIQDYGSVENVLANAAKIDGKLGEKIRAGAADVHISKKLVSLADDIEMDLDWKDLELAKPHVHNLNQFFHKLEFKKLLMPEQGSLLADEAPVEKKHAKYQVEFVLVNTNTSLESLAQKIHAGAKKLAFDTETDALDSHSSNLVGISLCFEKERAYYIPVAHKTGENLELKTVREILNPVFRDTKIEKLAQNAKFDLNVLTRHGFDLKAITDDTLIASYLCDPDSQHNLDYLADKYLNHTTIKFSDVVPKGGTFADVELQKAADYSAEDSWVAHELNAPLKEELALKHLNKVYSEIEIPLIAVLSKMELNGILVDIPFLDKLHHEFTTRLAAHEKQIYKLAGEEFNINSPKQLAVILFDKLKMPIVKKTKTGYSTDVDVLTELSRDHELPGELLKFRTVAKLLSTYVVQLKALVNSKTGRVHTSFNQTIAATGRLSSTEPNLQNIPIKTDEGKRIREAFIAPEGCELVSFDYSQIELRLLAAFTEDTHLMNAYKNDEDIHARTAAQILGVKITDVDSHQRAIGKTINFGVIYGQSAFGLASQLGVSQAEAKHFIDGFYREFASVRDYKERVLTEARKLGFVSTYLGRRRYVPDLNSKNFNARLNAERVAFNTVFQGSAADLIKKAMIVIHHKLLADKFKSRMLLQVHDELIFEVPKNEKIELSKMVTHVMETAFDLKVALKVGVSFGKTWAACE